ncbi:hypothetical protein [Pontibacter vulgaris]|uniref:hypothetical protein n=1 Tax=Pontibacter vulgaris TaxID=2905679 RepID=UPI001FA76FA8|nr:hypothetical protein [Pontibacter vulgaris]
MHYFIAEGLKHAIVQSILYTFKLNKDIWAAYTWRYGLKSRAIKNPAFQGRVFIILNASARDIFFSRINGGSSSFATTNV